MCDTRNWRSLEINSNSGLIIARRSDGLLIQLFELEFNSIRSFLEKLEEFRNCKCTLEAPCSKHLEERERIV